MTKLLTSRSHINASSVCSVISACCSICSGLCMRKRRTYKTLWGCMCDAGGGGCHKLFVLVNGFEHPVSEVLASVSTCICKPHQPHMYVITGELLSSSFAKHGLCNFDKYEAPGCPFAIPNACKKFVYKMCCQTHC